MTVQEMRDRVGSLSNYGWYIVILLCWYFLDSVYTFIRPIFPGIYVETAMFWGCRLLVLPFLLAGILGGIHEYQRSQKTIGAGGFFKLAKTHYWRVLGIGLWYMVFVILIGIAAVMLGFINTSDSDNNWQLLLVSIPFSAISLFWYAAVIVEQGKMARSLWRAVQTLVFSRFALFVGLLWGIISIADTAFSNFFNEQTVAAVTGFSGGIHAFARIMAGAYAFVIYKHARVEWFGESSEEILLPAPTATSSGDRWVKVSFGLAFVSFLPLFNLAALISGMIALKRKSRFVLRAAIACCLGGFFTLVYGLLVLGWFFGRTMPAESPDYTFMAEADASLQPYITLFEQGLFYDVQQQLEQKRGTAADHHWTFYCAAAIAKFYTHDINGALADFRLGLAGQPDKSAFYYYYGRALLENSQIDEAAGNFRSALNLEPRIADAQRFLALTQNAYTPSTTISSTWFVIILLILFPMHEYAHAFAAWKLGDDTAKDQGRLTLNPLPHLDLFGSIILPGILIWRQSDIIFGWAKPVPVNPENFSDRHKDHLVVSFAGPAMNLMISMVCFMLLGTLMLVVRIAWPEALALNLATPSSSVSLTGPTFAPWIVLVIVFLKRLFYTSLVLGCFNLIPVPPLDGSWIFSGLLPQGARNLFEQIRPYSFLLFLLLVMTPALDYFLTIPLGLAWGLLYLCLSMMGFG